MRVSFSVLPMDRAHLDGVLAIEKAVFSVPWSRKSFEDEIGNHLAEYFVALHTDGTVLGYGGMYIILDEGYITNIAVKPELKRRGVASAIIERLISVAVSRDLNYLSLEVRVSNAPAISLYERYNFKKVGLRVGYYSEPLEDAIIMLRTVQK